MSSNNDLTDNDKNNEDKQRVDVISLLDNFIDQIQNIRKLLIGIALAAIALAPVAIILSIYLFTHPAMYRILDNEDEFGDGLIVLLVSVLVISTILLITGIFQYRRFGKWNKQYQEYRNEKEKIEKEITKIFRLDKDSLD